MRQSHPIVAVLDDEPRMRKALHRLLTTHGFFVDDYERGEDFLAALPLRPPDCLVLDLHMPGITGIDVLSAFQAEHVDTPVVVITGHDSPETRQKTLELGALAYLTKPVDEAALLAAIHAALSPDQSVPT